MPAAPGLWLASSYRNRSDDAPLLSHKLSASSTASFASSGAVGPAPL